MKTIIFILSLIILGGCSSSDIARERETPSIYKGYYIGGSEIREYRLDQSEEWMWVVDNTSELEKTYQSFKLKPNEEVYLEVEGVIRENDTPGEFSEKYHNLIEIYEVIKITPLVN